MTETTFGADELFEQADRALYRSKRCGKNQVSHF
jgi:GGDEF domain-containing protein